MAVLSNTDDQFTFTLNGRQTVVQGWPAQTTLLEYVRQSGLTGAKEGCAEGECGACAVVMVREHGPERAAYRAVNSCLLFLPMVAGQEVYTVESLAQRGELNVVQQALAANGSSQCGYCTPGFVMSLFAEHYRPDRSGACDPEALGGNLCRCTGYRPIREAACSLGVAAADDAFGARLRSAAPAIQETHYRSFDRPASVDACLDLLARDPAAQLIAGGTDLGVDANLKHYRFAHLISVEAIPELRQFSENDNEVRIGAALPLSDLARLWTSAPPVVREWLPQFASPLLRNRATLGGSLATASPIGDSAPVLLALDSQVEIASPQGRRSVPLCEFFTGYRQTALAAGELLTTVTIPKPLAPVARFYKVAKRRLDDISTVAACFALTLDRQHKIVGARVAYGGVAATPVRLYDVEAFLPHRDWTEETADAVQQLITETLRPMTDHRGTAAYRLAIAASLFEKFWCEDREEAKQ